MQLNMENKLQIKYKINRVFIQHALDTVAITQFVDLQRLNAFLRRSIRQV